MELRFRAPEYGADDRFEDCELEFSGDPGTGWRVRRNGESWLELGAGFVALETLACGVCSTDLSRRFLPFPLPQVTGHEIVARDGEGRRVVVEINASHAARGVEGACPFCSAGLGHHCPERLVVGIHDLPGGFGPRLLAPRGGVVEVPRELSDASAVLVEPFAAALHVLDVVRPRRGDVVAVVGPRRLGLLVVAALAAHRRRGGERFEIVALSRHEALNRLARELGADDALRVDGDGAALPDALADLVVDTSGSASGFELALRLARRELHLKSTSGRPAAGLAQLTAFVVDELSLARWAPEEALDGPVGWLVDGEPPPPGARSGATAAKLLAAIAGAPARLPRYPTVVAGDLAAVDAAIRPAEGGRASLVAPRGRLLLHERARGAPSPLVEAILGRGLRLSSSRCGELREALAWMAADPLLAGLGERFVTHRFPPSRLSEAFAAARSTDCLKAVVEHGDLR